jgi:hypothetical protein
MTGPVLRRALSVVCAASAMSMGLGGSGAAAAQQGAFVTRTLAEPAAPGTTGARSASCAGPASAAAFVSMRCGRAC